MPVPKFEPEVIEAEARKRWRGDDEKVPTTSVGELTVRNVKITSRYNKAHEFNLMEKMICALPPELCASVKSIFCDSKVTFCFSVMLYTWNGNLAHAVGCALNMAAFAHNYGHNGISVAADDGSFFGDNERRIDIDAEWK